MILGKKQKTKAGVSLVTVLLFMLVATIAATATYKWLISENRSSGSRMQQQEAYQSAVAGIESARSWMTYHASETGALIKQYKDNKNTPIKLTDQLAEFVRAGQSYDVWLVGVDAETSPYKLKVMSTGRARNGQTTHSELAIFNVNGLYKMSMTKRTVSVNTNFRYAYFGGSTNFQGGSMPSSMVINGNWSGNPIETTDGDFVVTGNASLNGNNISVSDYACFGGDLYTNNGFKSKYLYVAGNTTNFTGVISQDAYFDGDMDMSNACGSLNFYVKGNMTVGNNAKVRFENCQDNRKIDGNTCVIDNGQILADGNKVYLNGGAWMDSDYPLGRTDNSDDASNIIVGSDNADKVYIKNGHPYSDYTALVDKEYHETNSKKYCPNSFKIARAANANNWNGTPPRFVETTEADPLRVCGTLYSQEADERSYYCMGPNCRKCTGGYLSGYYCHDAYFVDYRRGWENWTDQKYSGIFPSNEDKEGLYYLYKAPNDFLVFDNNRTLSGWKVFKNIPGGNFDDLKEVADERAAAVPIHIDGSKNFDEYFRDDVVIGGYKFNPGDIYYYDPTTDENNTAPYNNVNHSPYCYNGGGTEGKYRPTCSVKPWFTVKGEFKSWSTTKPADLVCAEGVKEHCRSIWGDPVSGGGCEESNYKVNDMLITGYTSFVEKANAAPCAAAIANLDGNQKQNFLNSEGGYNGTEGTIGLNTCYSNAVSHDASQENEADKYLYNGYLVLQMSDAVLFKSVNHHYALDGKFIFIIDSREGEALKLPRTAGADDFVMLYLPEGYGEINFQDDIKETYDFNYFIYSNGPITKIMGNYDPNKLDELNTFKGSVYVTASSCAKVNDMWSSKLVYNSELMTDMMMNNLLCSATSESCGGLATTPSPDPVEGEITQNVVEKPDDYYIAAAPQLSITLESQYKNNENVQVSKAASVEGSFIVLPRIVYLTRDAVGELSHYYNVVTLNSSTPAAISNISCSGQASSTNTIPVSGSLTANGSLTEDTYTCTVQGSVAGKSQKVPFYVKVKGSGATAPKVSFAKPSAELAVGNEEAVELTWDKTTGAAGAQCNVTLSVSSHGNEWVVSPSTGVTGSEPDFTVSFNTSDNPPKQVFNVRNDGSSDGAVYFLIKEISGCQPGNSTEVIYNSNSMTVKRADIGAYCSGPGSTTAECAVGGRYKKMIDSDWPDCNVSATWVNVDGGSNCSPSTPNSTWSCGVTGTLTLVPFGTHTGCTIEIPSTNNSVAGPFTTNQEVTLYASIKAEQHTFHAGFSVEGTPSPSPGLVINVSGPGTYSAEYTCTYADYQDSERKKLNCDVPVYRGSSVSLSLTSANTKDFNYWKCGTGSTNCTAGQTSVVMPYVTSVTGDNTVMAHFGERDRHCFFDEFKEGSEGIRYNRVSIECSGDEATYCIDNCGSTCASAATPSEDHPKSKWHLIQGLISNLDYLDGRISQKSLSTRGKKEVDKASIKTVIMSTAQAGRSGELKAQFQVPRLEVSDGDIGAATVKNSGFILRSTATMSSYLLLNVYSKRDGSVFARVCLPGTNPEQCKEKKLTNNTSKISPNDMVMMSATIGPDGNNGDALEVEIWPNSWSSTSDKVKFSLKNSELSGVESVTGEYVGYSLADPNFKLQGIGWKSSTYGSQCWDTHPTISCSFRAAYPGGIVPQKDEQKIQEEVRPWTGLSAWYGSRSCTIDYYYKGDDACNASADADPKKCSYGYYEFTASGEHGYKDDGVDVRTAYAATSNCDVYGDEANWATKGVAAHCGKFWVGKLNDCTKDFVFAYTTGGPEGDYYAPPAGLSVANLRGATLKVNIGDNPNEGEIEIYLYSKNSSSGFYDTQFHYSMPYKTKRASGIVEIPVEDISSADGFDPENVFGVYVKTFGDNSIKITSVNSACPNVIGLKCNESSVSYNVSANKWVINSVVNNYSHTAKIEVTKKNNSLSDPSSVSCNWPTSSPVCSWSNQSGLQATNTLEWSGKPYQSSDDEEFTFVMTLTGDESNTPVGSCEKTWQKEAIECEFDQVTTTPTVEPGAGLPAFNYTIRNCPDKGCSYKITLNTGTTVVPSTTLSDCEKNPCVEYTRSIPTPAANKADKLAEQENYYYFTLESTNSDRAFSSCQSPKFNVKKSTVGVVTGACSFASSTITAGSTVQLNITDRGQSAKWDERGSDNILATLSGGGSSSSVTVNRHYNAPIDVAPPKTPGEYTYSITYDGNTFCTAKVTVQALNNVLSATCPTPINTYPLASTSWGISMNGYANLTKTVSRTLTLSGVDSWNKDCSSTACGDMDAINAPADTGHYTYSLTADNEPLCADKSYVVKSPLKCYVNDNVIANGDLIEINKGASFKFKAVWDHAYGDGTFTGCSITGSNATTGNSNPCYNNHSKFNSDVTIIPNGIGDKPYEYSVNLSYGGNSAGPFKCNWKVKVKQVKPSFDCKDNLTATIGEDDNVTIGLENVAGCDEGGDYCHYRISGWGSTATEQTGYTGGDFPALTVPETTKPNDGDTAKYVVELENSAGWSDSKTCVVKFKKSSGGSCGCPDVGCGSMVEDTNHDGYDGGVQAVCYHSTHKPNWINTGNCSFKLNGTAYGTYQYVATGDLPDAADYYIQVQGDNGCYWGVDWGI